MTVVRPVRDFSVSTDTGLDGGEVKNVIPGAACFGDSAFFVSVALKGQSLSYRMVASVPPGGGAHLPLTLSLRVSPDGARHTRGREFHESRRGSHSAHGGHRVQTQPGSDAGRGQANRGSRRARDDGRCRLDRGDLVGRNGASTIEERWTPATGGSMLAVSRTHRTTNGAQTAFEFLCIAERAGSLVYTAMPNASTPATDFMLTRKDANSVTFENPAHDFPKMIRYSKRADGGLDATISAERASGRRRLRSRGSERSITAGPAAQRASGP